MATIYLSSTYEDLQDYRRVLFDALRKSGYQVIAMEDYVAADQRPVDQCLNDVEKADIYVGLFAFRYGYVPPSDHNNPDGLSITELEFLHAKKLKKPCLTFIAKEDAGILLKLVDAYTGDGVKGKQIERLRKYLLKEKLCGEFSAPHELASLVQAAVTKHLEEQKTPASSDAKEPATQVALTWDINEKGSPYPGLMNFTREYAPVFFGRDLEVREILDRMHLPEGRFILVSGDSGVGKSSVVAAGVLPVIEERGLPGGESCEILHMLPGKAPQPWSSLMMAGLGALVTRAGLRPDELLEDLARDPDTFTGHINSIIKKATKSHALLLFLDQMEELFTSQEITQSNRFLTALYHAAQGKALWIVATIRSDHLHYCHGHDEMRKILNGQGHYALGPVDRFMMQDMIVKPAQCAGLRISERLARRLIADTEEDSANLPLLAFVLNQLFEQRIDHELSEARYSKLGGVGGAIAAHVRTVEHKIQTELRCKTDEVLPDIFQTLIKFQREESVPTRNHPPVAGFKPHLRTVINLLVTQRLLRTEGEGEAATVSISHEKLLEAWPALREYVATHQKVLVDRTLLESRARKWVNRDKPWFDGLASGREYKDFRRAEMADTSLTKEYLSASRRARWIQTGVIGLLILLFGGMGAWLWKEEATVQYAWSVVRARLHLVQVPEPKMVPIPNKPYAMGRYEVTCEEYDAYARLTGRRLPDDSGWGRDKRPVINVSWEDAVAYAKWLKSATGKPYRLPRDEEWMHTARSGEQRIPRPLENLSDHDLDELSDSAWFSFNSNGGTQPVGTKKANGLRLYDMRGNVWEWVQDCVDEGVDENKCSRHVILGGSWQDTTVVLDQFERIKGEGESRKFNIGFRLAQDTP